METSVFDRCISQIEQRFSQLPDKRVGSNRFIKMKDVGLSAFSVFFTQCSSFLEHQRAMKTKEGRDNASSLFTIDHIPSDNHIRYLLDEVPASELFPLFSALLNDPAMEEALKQFRHVEGQVLIPLDGLHYFSSKKIACEQCSSQTHSNGETTYSHSMMSATLVHPERSEVLPLIPMFVAPQDGREKQDCEREACKRWLLGVGAFYARLKATLLGDDLYCCEPICQLAIQQGFHFIFTCKPESHKCLYEWIDSLEKGGGIREIEKTVGSIKGKRLWRCRYVNEVPLRDGKAALQVNWCEVDVLNEQGQRVYYNTFVTDHVIHDGNVVDIVKAGRTRWKTENEHNNTLKNHGYHLEHNFGHGKKHLSQVLVTLILLSFLLHTVLRLTDRAYQRIGDYFPRASFFNQLRTLLMYLYFATWSALMALMLNACKPPPKQRRKRN